MPTQSSSSSNKLFLLFFAATLLALSEPLHDPHIGFSSNCIAGVGGNNSNNNNYNGCLGEFIGISIPEGHAIICISILPA